MRSERLCDPPRNLADGARRLVPICERLLIGRPLQFGQKFGELDQYRAVTDLLGKYNVPIVMDLDIGHLHPAMPLIVGSYAKVAVEGNEIEIKMECR